MADLAGNGVNSIPRRRLLVDWAGRQAQTVRKAFTSGYTGGPRANDMMLLFNVFLGIEWIISCHVVLLTDVLLELQDSEHFSTVF